MRDYRTIDDITEEYLCDHPDEIDDYVTELFEEYAQDGDIATLRSSLRVRERGKIALLMLPNFEDPGQTRWTISVS